MLIALLSLLIWVGLLAFREQFWLARDTDEAPVPDPAAWPAVTAIIPARDEAEVIGRAIASHIAQDYPGDFRIVLVDDGSSDGTAQIAQQAAQGSDRLAVIAGTPPPSGWTGKLWAMRNGVEQAGDAPDYLWFTDADIAHAPDTLRSLVARSEREKLALNSLMAELRCDSLAEKAMIPAFVLFFQMLYPFRLVNRPQAKLAAAAGGCMLVRREALARAGGLAVIADAIIDDCAMGETMKRQGPIRLSLTRRSVSLRPYGGWGEIVAMISRSAYAQLNYSPLLLAGTLIGLLLMFVAPVGLALFGSGGARLCGALAWLAMAVCTQPMLRFYRQSPLWGLAMPAIGMIYAAATFLSAWQHWNGRGGMWKGRAQARGT
ncbi:glycosyltransferase [Sphingomonas oryzagri]|uniref:Glycosyltransferase n=1 Tax=Sphingomonas oryzagri TaxID=3042314 RepID=A0ABT6N3P6_9SPHN|nr:glycosyltransferase [Sphingomonas oryzagri]MDH7639792.1 glycosyltransferase [Sphingomonas oryzagri]